MKPKVILGVTASDAHIVGNHLINHMLQNQGYEVLNLGACTPVAEFFNLYVQNPDVVAILIGSVNGHAYEDLVELREIRDLIHCPIILGGNLTVGSQKQADDLKKFYALGIDHILDSHAQLTPLLSEITNRTFRFKEAR